MKLIFATNPCWLNSGVTGRDTVYLLVYRQRRRRCLRRRYLFFLGVWDLCFSYLLNSSGDTGVIIFLPEEVDNYKDFLLINVYTLGKTAITMTDILKPLRQLALLYPASDPYISLECMVTRMDDDFSSSLSIGKDLDFIQPLPLPNIQPKYDVVKRTHRGFVGELAALLTPYAGDLVKRILNTFRTHLIQRKINTTPKLTSTMLGQFEYQGGNWWLHLDNHHSIARLSDPTLSPEPESISVWNRTSLTPLGKAQPKTFDGPIERSTSSSSGLNIVELAVPADKILSSPTEDSSRQGYTTEQIGYTPLIIQDTNSDSMGELLCREAPVICIAKTLEEPPLILDEISSTDDSALYVDMIHFGDHKDSQPRPKKAADADLWGVKSLRAAIDNT